jgi:hypothetical protein
MNEITKLPIGQQLDAEICRRAFGICEWRIRVLRLLHLLPRYSTSWAAATHVTSHFSGLPPDSVNLKRDNEWLSRLGTMNSRSGIVGAVVIGSCPSNACDVALFAVLDQAAD